LSTKILQDVLDAFKTDTRCKTDWLIQTYGYNSRDIKNALKKIEQEAINEIIYINNNFELDLEDR